MVLNDADIEALAHSGAIRPYNPDNLQPASYDVTLSPVYRTISVSDAVLDQLAGGVIDPFDQNTLDVITERHEATEHILIHPGQFLLAGTIERIGIPPYLVGRIEGRSSLGRLGLAVHITAGYLDPGFVGNLTLECFNTSPYIIKLTPGMRIAQVGFMKMTKYARKPYAGRYQGDTEVQHSRYGKNMEDQS